MTFLIPAGKFSTDEVEYMDSNGEIKTRAVLRADTFRYSYNLDTDFLANELSKLAEGQIMLDELGINKDELGDIIY